MKKNGLCQVMMIVAAIPMGGYADTFAPPSNGAGFVLGSGYNSVSAAVLANCVEPSELITLGDDPGLQNPVGQGQGERRCNDSQCVDFYLSQVTSAQELRESLGIEANASLGLGVFSADVSTRYYEQNRYTNNNIYIVLRVKVTNDPKRFRDLNLVDWARQLLVEGDTAQFLRRCGDGFVAGRTTGGEFRAVIKINTSSAANAREVQAQLSASGITWSANVQIQSTLQRISENNRIEVTMFRRGGIGELPSHSDIPALFQFARTLPTTVQSNANPAVYLVTTMSYDSVSNLPSENTSLLAQRRILENIATSRDTAFEKWGDVDFVLRNPTQFEAFDQAEITNYRTRLGIVITALIHSAGVCESTPLQCVLPAIDWPEGDLPARIYRQPERQVTYPIPNATPPAPIPLNGWWSHRNIMYQFYSGTKYCFSTNADRIARYCDMRWPSLGDIVSPLEWQRMIEGRTSTGECLLAK